MKYDNQIANSDVTAFIIRVKGTHNFRICYRRHDSQDLVEFMTVKGRANAQQVAMRCLNTISRAIECEEVAARA